MLVVLWFALLSRPRPRLASGTRQPAVGLDPVVEEALRRRLAPVDLGGKEDGGRRVLSLVVRRRLSRRRFYRLCAMLGNFFLFRQRIIINIRACKAKEA